MKTTTNTNYIPFVHWLTSTEEGKKFLETCDTYTDPDDPVLQEVIRSFGADGWVGIWVIEDGEPEDFPFVKPDLTEKDAFAELYGAIKKNDEDSAILLTYGPNYADERENYAYDCLKAIAGDTYTPLPH